MRTISRPDRTYSVGRGARLNASTSVRPRAQTDRGGSSRSRGVSEHPQDMPDVVQRSVGLCTLTDSLPPTLATGERSDRRRAAAALDREGGARWSTEQHGTARDSTGQHGTARDSTGQHGTARDSTGQTAQDSMGEHSEHGRARTCNWESTDSTWLHSPAPVRKFLTLACDA